MPKASELINRSNTICHYKRFSEFSEPNCNGCNDGDSKMVELLHLFAENRLTCAPECCQGMRSVRSGQAKYLPFPAGRKGACQSSGQFCHFTDAKSVIPPSAASLASRVPSIRE